MTFQFVPYHEIDGLSGLKRINKLISLVKQSKIVMLEGRLNKEEEANLIEMTMEEIGDKFKGIELAVINPDQGNMDFFKQVKHGLARMLIGDRQGFTIVGPASIVKKIKQNPGSLELLTQEQRRTKINKNKRK